MEPVPTSLKIIAYLSIVSGIIAVMDIAHALFQSRINFNMGVIGIFLGVGLLRLKPWWWKCAFFFACIGIVLTFVMLFLSFFKPLTISCFGVVLQPVSVAPGVIISCAALAYCCWEYSVLNNPKVRRLFGR